MKTETIPQTLKMTQSVSEYIRATVGKTKAERGGIGYGYRTDMIVREFIFDPREGTNSTYTLNANFFNPISEKIWDEKRYEPIMFAHSHPPGYTHPSLPDDEIGRKYLERFELLTFYFPIIISCADQPGFQFLPYAYIKD